SICRALPATAIWLTNTCPKNASAELLKAATRRRFGSMSWSNLTCFAPSSAPIDEVPVMLPPGCARLLTSPTPTGSPLASSTIGTSQHDRNLTGRMLCRERGVGAEWHNNIDPIADQGGRHFGQA